MKYDTVYACLASHVADCVGRGTAFNVLMPLEGILAQSVGCHVNDAPSRSNYVMTWMGQSM